jgi:DNA-binding transcriptional LysR family regulator
MDIDFRDLEAFISVAKLHSFSRAAEQLFTTQPALSRKISEIECRVGLPLLTRTTRKVDLTPAGEVFLKHSVRLCTGRQALLADMEKLSAGQNRILRIGYRSEGEFDSLLHAIDLLRTTRPGIEVEVLWNHLLEELYDGTCDAVVTCLATARSLDWVAWRSLGHGGLCAFVSADHPLAAHSSISINELTPFKLILPRASNRPTQDCFPHLPDCIFRALLSSGIHADQMESAADSRAFRARIALDESVGIMPASSRVIASDVVICIPIADTPADFDAALVWRKGDKNPLLAALIDAIQ